MLLFFFKALLCSIVTDYGFLVGFGLAVGLGPAVGLGLALGLGLAVGLGPAVGLALAVGLGPTVGFGLAVGLGPAVGLGAVVGLGFFVAWASCSVKHKFEKKKKRIIRAQLFYILPQLQRGRRKSGLGWRRISFYYDTRISI